MNLFFWHMLYSVNVMPSNIKECKGTYNIYIIHVLVYECTYIFVHTWAPNKIETYPKKMWNMQIIESFQHHFGHAFSSAPLGPKTQVTNSFFEILPSLSTSYFLNFSIISWETIEEKAQRFFGDFSNFHEVSLAACLGDKKRETCGKNGWNTSKNLGFNHQNTGIPAKEVIAFCSNEEIAIKVGGIKPTKLGIQRDKMSYITNNNHQQIGHLPTKIKYSMAT